ncbi:fimbrial biogenesis chaperone [Pantoea sp. FN060301]|uniref:fimbrial biogenesis chaperone n=1 Tax=Pantoea sp. FN060301 TaxID=3420380 RepID=UPI003D17A43F
MRNISLLFTLVFLFISMNVNAGVIIGGSRMIYQGDKKEDAISIENPDASPFLIQSWIEDATGTLLKDNTPFIVTPPLFRLDSKQKNILRIVRTMRSLPQDKESLFWLNIKSIPSKSNANDNTLQIAVRSRLKLIYRPDSLSDEGPEQQAMKLKWARQNNKLTVTNPSAYFINFMSVRINNKKITEGGFVSPGASVIFNIPTGITTGDLSWRIINDYGGIGAEHHTQI